MHMKPKRPKKLTAKEEAERLAAIRGGLGKYAWVPTSSDDFARRKQQEIELEERSSQRFLK